MRTFAIALAFGLIAAAQAECPGGCSGHGTCGAKDACSCFDNWMGGDCSQRVCPFGLAFVDTPLGDLNHDGAVSHVDGADGNSDADAVPVQWSNAAVGEVWQGSQADEAHFYSECSGKGSCDRSAGECQCYDGFTGSACQRTTCQSDCSGHGQCYTLRDIASGPNIAKYYPGSATQKVGRNFRVEGYSYGVYSTSGVSEKFDYDLWDADKNQACVCDAGFFGPDCSLRDCPRGNDPLTTDTKHCGGSTCASEVQYILIKNKAVSAATAIDTATLYFEWTDQEDYSGLLTTLRSNYFDVRNGLTGDEYAEVIQNALESFPNSALAGVAVTCTSARVADGLVLAAFERCNTALDDHTATGYSSVLLKVDFSNGPQGNVNALVVKAAEVLGDNHMRVNVINYAASYNAGAADIAVGETFGSNVDTSVGTADVVTAANYAAAGPAASVPTAIDGNQENLSCSNRGLCDYSNGQCQCFAGYTREDCSVQSALSM